MNELKYDHWLRQHPQGNLWQSLERKKYLEACGKDVTIETIESDAEIRASALIVKDRSKGGTVWEIPRGPVWSDEGAVDQLLTRIVANTRDEGVLALYVSPIKELPNAPSPSPLPRFGGGAVGGGYVPVIHKWKKSDRKIHAAATRVIDLTLSEEEMLKQMHQKGRYNIRVAEKSKVTVREGTEKDIDSFYELLQSTGSRDGFLINQKAHYSRFLTSLDGSFLLIAEHEHRPISGLIGVIWNGFGIYYYGASSYEDRALMSPYLLQWEAIKHCKKAGCTKYDLLGISHPDADEKGSWSGITDFKRKFGGEVVTYPAESVLILKPLQKKLLDLKRKLFR